MQQTINRSSIKKILEILKVKIARRTSDNDALTMLSRFIEELGQDYEFLKNVKINNKIYSESESIHISSNLNEIDVKLFSEFLYELVRKSVREMKEKADFFFIREFQDAIKDINKVQTLIIDKIPLNEMQHEYLIQRTHTLAVIKNQLLIDMIYSLLSIANNYYPDEKSVNIVEESLFKLIPKYPFLRSVTIVKRPEERGYYTVEIRGSVEQIPIYQFTDALFQLIIITWKNLHINDVDQYILLLKRTLGERNVDTFQKLGISLNNIPLLTTELSKKKIMHQLIDCLIQIIGYWTSKKFSVTVLSTMMKKINIGEKYIKKIHIKNNNMMYNIIIDDDFESIDSDTFRQIIRSLIENIGIHLGHKRKNFIEELKRELGEEYADEIENYGINFHILEMKFR